MNKLQLILLLFPLLMSCDDEELSQNSQLNLNFSHQVGALDFAYGNSYKNSAGNDYSINLWRTYISDIVLVDESGDEFKVVDSYHLIEPSSGTTDTVLLGAVPKGKYLSISFKIGVPEEANLTTDLLGDLDPSNNMAWNWVKGYKFIRVDGEFIDLNAVRRGLVIHIGTEENLKQLMFNFSTPIIIDGGTNNLDFSVDLSALFNGPNIIDFEVLNDFQFNIETKLISDNYSEGYIRLTNN